MVGSWCVGGHGVSGSIVLGWEIRVQRNRIPVFRRLPFRVADSQSGW